MLGPRVRVRERLFAVISPEEKYPTKESKDHRRENKNNTVITVLHANYQLGNREYLVSEEINK